MRWGRAAWRMVSGRWRMVNLDWSAGKSEPRTIQMQRQGSWIVATVDLGMEAQPLPRASVTPPMSTAQELPGGPNP